MINMKALYNCYYSLTEIQQFLALCLLTFICITAPMIIAMALGLFTMTSFALYKHYYDNN
jgi:hypothetical protein